MRSFVIAHHRAFVQFGLALFIVSAALFVCGCAVPTWISDIDNLIPVILSAFGGLASVITGFLGGSALETTITNWITEIETGVNDVEELVEQYQQSADPTVLNDIEAALADVKTNLQTDFSNLGLPAVLLSVIAQVASITLATLQAIVSVIPAFAAKAGTTLSITVPMNKAELRGAYQTLFKKTTGDPKLDALLLKVKV